MNSRARLRNEALSGASFERFVAESSIRLLRTAYLLTGDRSGAEDLLQQALLRTARRWRSAQGAAEAYTRRVLVNLARDRHRGARRRVAESPLEEADPAEPDLGSDPADVVAGREAVMKALARLPIEQREVLVLRFYADLSVAETAAAIGASQGTVKSRTSRALVRMRALLTDPPCPRPTPVQVADDH